jgi:hypothetical protein
MLDNPDIARSARGRRRWAWILACCLAGSAGAFAVAFTQFPDPDSFGSGAGVSIGALLGIATFVSGMVCLGYGLALQSHRADPHGAARSAPAADSRSRRETPGWAAWIGALVVTGLGVGMLPVPVNGIAYLAGAGQHATFTPVSYHQECDKGCHTVTDGFVTAGAGRTSATWPGKVPLGRPVQTRLAVWEWWGSSNPPVGGPGDAARDLFLGGFWVLFCGSALYLAAARITRRLRARRLATPRRRSGGAQPPSPTGPRP